MKLDTFQKFTYYEKHYSNVIDGIPEKSGIYYWVYHPTINDDISVDNLEKKLLEYTKVNLFFTETLTGPYKFKAVISEQWYKDNGNIFGLSEIKKNRLLNYFRRDNNNIKVFLEFFERICFSRPFYVGKADNLRTRLVKQHFKGTSSSILGEIKNNNVSLTEIYIGFEEIEDLENDEINEVFEEIFSRRTKPALTKRPN